MIRILKEDIEDQEFTIEEPWENLEDETFKKIILNVNDGDLQRILREMFDLKDRLNNDVAFGFLLGLHHCGKLKYNDYKWVVDYFNLTPSKVYKRG